MTIGLGARRVRADRDDEPVLDVGRVTDPVRVVSLELLREGNAYLVRARSNSGAESVTVPNPARMADFYPVFVRRVAPFFVGTDARALEDNLWQVYRHRSNYKYQGIALWSCVAAVEMALLDLMGIEAGRPLADFFGGALRRDIPVYYASGNRGNTPEEEIRHLRGLVAKSGSRAIKFRLGGRMSRNEDSRSGRTEALIPLVRETFGPQMTLYADANSSYNVAEAIRIGRLMEAHDYGFFEEPCPFDHLWETKQVADALTIPIAGGEQEFSLRRFRWAIENRAVDIAQPDLFYGGGFIRASRVARWAEAAGMPVVPHMSGGGLGAIQLAHFLSFTPNIGPHHEFKGDPSVPVRSETSSLRCEDGILQCPSGPGFGVTVDPDYVRRARPVVG